MSLDMPDDALRGTGRTTALMLQAIADALQHPDEHVEFRDHSPMGYTAASALLASLRGKIDALHLTMDTCIINSAPHGRVILLRSPISRMRQELEGR